jgi:dipeptidase
MCDTMVAAGGQSVDGAVLFGKNSDRERNEAQYLEAVPRRSHRKGAKVRLTHVEIDEAPESHAVLLSKPFWIWGAEIGANEHGVVIGNEAVYGKRMPSLKPGVIGMDYLRLGLERGASAEEALDVITRLLARHGQGGNCGHLKTRTYHNSFIIADTAGAWVLETIGRDWVAEHVDGVRTISNALSIEKDYDRISDGMKEKVGDRSVASTMTNPRRDRLSQGKERCARSTTVLGNRRGRLDVHSVMAALRDHGPEERGWHPDQATMRSICMHAAWGTNGGQTTGAMASWLKKDRPALHWVTGSAAPCLSIFKPVFVDLGLPVKEKTPTGKFDAKTRWWKHEQLHRQVIEDFGPRSAAIAGDRDALEKDFSRRIAKVVNADAETRREAVAACWAEADAAEARWAETIPAMGCSGERPAAPYRRAWTKFNRIAGFA